VAAGVVPEEGAGEARVDFGGALLPHRVSAIAYGETGIEIGRDEEWVNLPRPEIVARLVLHGDPWTPDRASLIWEHLAEHPVTVQRVTATLDGRPLAVPDPQDIRLPRPDPDVPHLLALDVTFSNGERMELARAWGGGGIDEVETRLLPFRVATQPCGGSGAARARARLPRGRRGALGWGGGARGRHAPGNRWRRPSLCGMRPGAVRRQLISTAPINPGRTSSRLAARSYLRAGVFTISVISAASRPARTRSSLTSP
jgi:hypothetical protein